LRRPDGQTGFISQRSVIVLVSGIPVKVGTRTMPVDVAFGAPSTPSSIPAAVC
jgi:hypothetical protein